jgi:hypothetical protein
MENQGKLCQNCIFPSIYLFEIWLYILSFCLLPLFLFCAYFSSPKSCCKIKKYTLCHLSFVVNCIWKMSTFYQYMNKLGKRLSYLGTKCSEMYIFVAANSAELQLLYTGTCGCLQHWYANFCSEYLLLITDLCFFAANDKQQEGNDSTFAAKDGEIAKF